jgi:TetR/AcrR family transcriptional regulator, transcriptional repressor for nem operon
MRAFKRHGVLMTKATTRNRILEHAGRIVLQKGFNNTGIQEILESAGVPKGSFYFYFKSKDDLGLALIDHYSQAGASMRDALMTEAEGTSLQRLQRFFQARRKFIEEQEWRYGCPIGNLTQEMCNLSEAFRIKLRAVFSAMQEFIRECLEEARAQEELDPRLEPDELAPFILDSWEGALLRMKAEGSTEPLIRFEKMVFGVILGL